MNSNYKFGQGSWNKAYKSKGNNYPYRSNQRYVKKSGAKYVRKSDDFACITAWKKMPKSQGGGILSMFARPYKGTKQVKDKKGRHWENWFVTFTHNYRTWSVSGMFEVDTKKLIMNDLNLVASPSRNYFGKRFVKR